MEGAEGAVLSGLPPHAGIPFMKPLMIVWFLLGYLLSTLMGGISSLGFVGCFWLLLQSAFKNILSFCLSVMPSCDLGVLVYFMVWKCTSAGIPWVPAICSAPHKELWRLKEKT